MPFVAVRSPGRTFGRSRLRDPLPIPSMRVVDESAHAMNRDRTLCPKTPRADRRRGFTLIELMATVAIAAILAAVAIPMYRDYVLRGRIIDATSRLSDFRVRMEQYFMDNRTYDAGGGKCGVADPTTTKDQSFDLKCTGASATAYTAKATGVAGGPMSKFEYQIVASGAKATNALPVGWTTTAGCWVTKKDGSC